MTATVHIEATPERVFEHFTRPEALLSWMGEHAVLVPTPGGEFTVDIAGVPVRGRYLEVEPPHRLLISWGHAGADRLPPGASLLEVRLHPEAGGTTLTISRSGLPQPEATRTSPGMAALPRPADHSGTRLSHQRAFPQNVPQVPANGTCGRGISHFSSPSTPWTNSRGAAEGRLAESTSLGVLGGVIPAS